MATYKVVSKDGTSYTVGTDNIIGVMRTAKGVGSFRIKVDDIVKIVKVKPQDGEWIEV